MKHHQGGPPSPPIWRFTAAPPFTKRHSAAQTALLELLNQGKLTMQNITQMEQAAIQEARRAFAEALVACGTVDIQTSFGPTKINLIDAFAPLSAAQVDMLLERVWDALRASMMRQSAQGEVPFPLDPPEGYIVNSAGHLLKKGLSDDEIPF